MEIKGWEEIERETWAALPLGTRATITFGDPYKIVFIADSQALKDLKQEEDERTNAETGKEGVEGDSSGAEDSETQHRDQPGTDQSAA